MSTDALPTAASRSTGIDARLLDTDPRLLTPAERRDRLQALQRLAAQVEAAHLATLVAECGATPRHRTVVVDAPSDADAERESGQLGAGPGIRGPRLATGERQLVFTDEVIDELAPLLHRTHGSVGGDLRVARLLHGPLSLVRESLRAGRITSAHVRALCRQAARMQRDDLGADEAADAAFAEVCTEFQRRILPIAESSTPGRTESQAERLVAVLDAAAQRRRRERAKARMGVWAQAEGDGLMSITAILSSVDAARIMATVDARAEERRRQHTAVDPSAGPDPSHGVDPRDGLHPSGCSHGRVTIGQHRVHALLAMMGLLSTGSATDSTDSTGTTDPTDSTDSTDPATAVTAATNVEIQIVFDARSLLALAPGAADCPGWVQLGSHTPGAVDRDALLDLLADPSVPTTLRRLITDPVTGALIDRGAQAYTPTPDLIAWLIARDGGCRFPGCTARAYRCDVDHARDYADGGRTDITNTGLLCRRHHNGKTHGEWRIEESAPDGSCTFVAPDGTRHRCRPARIADPPTLDP